MKPSIVRYIEEALAEVIESMTGAEFIVTVDPASPEAPQLADAITWQQAFSPAEDPTLWIAAGKDLWDALGRATLGAAGIDDVTDEDCRSTWHEILNQAGGRMAAAMTAEQGREMTASKGAEMEAEPAGLAWVAFSVQRDTQNWPFKAAWAPELTAAGEPRRKELTAAAREAPASRTFDLLLEVALPVAVSFGRTSMQIREVLKLNTGSIVELDRFVSDPVEVIVNDCVIARGEVVVVDGNYGVRINHLASREERLRSGMAETTRKGGRP
ncbi:MAG TPA: flagellar motor switch protein FliN [Bryobacteraceae bacterium]|jgi:flagellar motor switch protein FliN/FliY|nr:flagellar motor switch protein FliN [Bryobacteraceae bacterium]